MKGFMKRGVGYRANEFVGNSFRVMRVERQKKKLRIHLDCIVSRLHEERSE